uniref:CBM21 domain-containing protein n=1 Tax=Strigamia maritima TaxID=126957 RepID=T1IHI1_STRMM
MTGGYAKDKWRGSWLVPCVMGSLPGLMSCKSRAEAFARHLQTKLRSLGGLISDDEIDLSQAVPATSVDIGRHRMKQNEPQPIPDDEELYYDFDLASSSGSPSSPDTSSQVHEASILRPLPVAMKDNLILTSDIARDQSEAAEANVTTDSSEDLDSACYSGGEHESNSYVLEQGQSNNSSEAREDGESSSFNFLTLSITAIKLDDDQPDEPIDGQKSMLDDETEAELTSPVWGTLKLIDRFHVRKEKSPEEEPQPVDDEKETEMPEVDISEQQKNYFLVAQVDDDNPAENTRPKRIYRSSSLKTGKTPPGTPGRKKIVRFADAFGLDLVDIKHVCLNDLPTVPKSAYNDLDESAVIQPTDNVFTTSFTKPLTSLMAMFSQPFTSANFLERVRIQKVCLETAVASEDAIKGQIRVLNLAFSKHVFVRYTMNEWRTFVELETNYLVGSNNTLTDSFSFVIFGADKLNLGQRIIFCIRYLTLNQEFWDNNNGHNYQFQCVQDCPTQSLNMVLGLADDDNNSFLF